MGSIQQLQATLNDTKSAVEELKAAAETEKKEVSDKLDTLDSKISEQLGLIVLLQEKLEAPESALDQLIELSADIRTATAQIRGIIVEL